MSKALIIIAKIHTRKKVFGKIRITFIYLYLLKCPCLLLINWSSYCLLLSTTAEHWGCYILLAVKAACVSGASSASMDDWCNIYLVLITTTIQDIFASHHESRTFEVSTDHHGNMKALYSPRLEITYSASCNQDILLSVKWN